MPSDAQPPVISVIDLFGHLWLVGDRSPLRNFAHG
jgi:hypothetical protein